MDKSQEATTVTDSTSTCILKNPNELQNDSIKKENDNLVQSKMSIKMEPLEDNRDDNAVAGTSYGMCSNPDVMIETVKIESKDKFDESVKDSLGDSSEFKVKNDEHLLSEPDNAERTEDVKQVGSKLSRDKDKKHTCHQCHRSFSRNYDLNRHLRVHTSEKPFLCSVCQKSFSLKNNLNNHMLIHSGEKPHACDICEKAFRQISDLSKHKLIHIGVKSFTCEECNKSFVRKDNLDLHKRKHSGDKPFMCEVCGKAFIFQCYLNKHSRLHKLSS